MIEIIIPIKNEMRNLYDFGLKYRHECSYIKKRFGNIRITFIDDSDKYEKGFLRSVLAYEKYNYRFIRGEGNYGDSLLKGISMINKCDKVIIMDIDHPTHKIIEMIDKLDRYEVVIGNDKKDNNQRKLTKWMCNNILKLDLKHPTCGFIGFNKNILVFIEPDRAKSKYDIIHVEWIKMCRNKNIKIGELDFDSFDIEHNYNYSRYIRWFYDFCRLVIMNIFGHYS